MAPPNKPASVDRRNQPSSSKEPEAEGPTKPGSGVRRPRAPSKEVEEGDAPPSNTLWVGNLSMDTTESDLMALFAKYGDLDSVTTYPARNYAFLYFKNLEDAKVAREALQGSLVRGNSLKIEFAKPAKPGKLLWIGGINSKVTKKELEEAFSEFGKIEEFKLHRDRNSALVDYYKVENAIDAMKNMNGKHFGGEKIRVDFLRSQPSRRGWSEHHDPRDMHFNKRNSGFAESPWLPSEPPRFFPESSQYGQRRHPYGGQRGQQSKVLRIRYPPSLPVDEQMLHNAMILFGEIENIKAFPSRHYAFVVFRSIDEARRAKEGLQGRLFGNPRIEITFSNSEFTATKDDVDFFSSSGGFGPDIFFNDHPPFGQPEFDGPRRPMGINDFPGPLFPNGVPGPNMLMRPFSPHGFDSMHNYKDGIYNEHPSANWSRLSPPMAGPHLSPGFRPPPRISQGSSWDGLDPRDRKRLRLDSPSFNDDMAYQSRMMGVQEVGDVYRNPQSPVVRDPNLGRPGKGISYGAGISDQCWHGIIAKGGTPVCQARCTPIGRGIESSLPEIVNCSARTSLDMLAKHYAEASGFDIVFFLPDSEEDFASYTEFLQYLCVKNRAGVAKLDDGTTLFLVPPSDFLHKVLNVSGPDRLYGVVLRLPQLSSTASMQQSSLSSGAIQQPSANASVMQSHINTNGYLPEVHPMKFGYNSTFAEESIPNAIPEKPPVPGSNGSQGTISVPPGSVKQPIGTTMVGASLTPDLIAQLASLIPASNPTLAIETGQVQVPVNPSTASSFLPSGIYDKGRPSQEWNQSHQSGGSSIQQQGQSGAPHQFGLQYSDQASNSSQVPNYTTVQNGSDIPFQTILATTLNQNPSMNSRHNDSLPDHSINNNYAMPSQVPNFPVPSSQHYQVDAGLSYQINHAMAQVTEGTGAFNFAMQQTQSSTQNQVILQTDPQNNVASIANRTGTEFANQLQQLQATLPSSSQEATISEADKNQRYQSTLQFAATLLQQIRQQQQQQQSGTQTVQGSKNQQ